MNLREALSQLNVLPEEATLFAERIDGSFRPESRAVVLELSDQDLNLSVKEIARDRAPGTEYFLEVLIAREVVDGWRANHNGCEPTLEQVLEGVVYYAEHDAYPESFFGKS